MLMLLLPLLCSAAVVRFEKKQLASAQVAAVAASGVELATSAAQAPVYTIRNGARGETVTYLQQLLNQHGLNTGVDGHFGPATERLVKRFQEAYGLSPDGVVGRATWAALQRPPQDPKEASGDIPAPSPLPEVLERAIALGHQVWGEPWRLWLYGIRGPTRDANAFDDTLGAAYVDDEGFWHVVEWPGTTDPGKHWLYNPMRREGTAILVEGQYLDTWTIAKHRGKYDALCQTSGNVRVYRDNSGDRRLDFDPSTIMNGKFGINLHASTLSKGGVRETVNTTSAGCQVHASEFGFAAMMELARMQVERTGRRTFSYTLLTEWRPGHAPPVALHTLRHGAEGRTVKHLQSLLNAHGYWCEANSDFDAATKTAVQAFQRASGLAADGVVGRGTWAALQRPLADEAPSFLTGPSRDGPEEAQPRRLESRWPELSDPTPAAPSGPLPPAEQVSKPAADPLSKFVSEDTGKAVCTFCNYPWATIPGVGSKSGRCDHKEGCPKRVTNEDEEFYGNAKGEQRTAFCANDESRTEVWTCRGCDEWVVAGGTPMDCSKEPAQPAPPSRDPEPKDLDPDESKSAKQRWFDRIKATLADWHSFAEVGEVGESSRAEGAEVGAFTPMDTPAKFHFDQPLGRFAPPLAMPQYAPAAPGPLPSVLVHAHTMGYKTWGEPWRVWLFGIRHPRKEANSFDDTLGAAYLDDSGYWQTVTWPATTDPGSYYLQRPLRAEGTAILAEGQYLDTYTIDLHRGKYEALCQTSGPVSVYRDNSRDTELDLIAGTTMQGYFGINIHAATQIEDGVSPTVDKWSAGCQVHASEAGFRQMMDLARMQVAKTGRKTFSYTLMQQWW